MTDKTQRPASGLLNAPARPVGQPVRIAIIGAGSLGFTRLLVRDIIGVEELRSCHIMLMDIDPDNLERVAVLCRRNAAQAGLPRVIEQTTDLQTAVTGVDFVICAIRQGGLEAFTHDVEIPLKYGVDQCVGDTLCAGGLMYAQRTIPALLNICAHIRRYARPGAILLNYSNPMAMNTIACNRWGGVPTIGLCHGVQGAHWQIAHAVEFYLKSTGRLPADYATIPGKISEPTEDRPFACGLHRNEVDVVVAGINHQTWFIQVNWRGENMLDVVREWMPEIPLFARTEKVRLDVLKRFGYYSTESNGHLSEYLPWYRKRRTEIADWIDTSNWIHGETGGYLRYCTDGRNQFDAEYETLLNAEPEPIGAEHRSEEHGSYIIESLVTGRPYRGHFNIINQGHITNLPYGCCVEIPGFVDGNGFHMPVIGELPIACAATCSASAHVQLMGAQAAVSGDVSLLKLAMLHDPLVGAVCNPGEVWHMADEMLHAQAQWLPQYADKNLANQ